MKALTAAAILAADDLATEALEVPQWGGTIHVRELTLAERMELGRMDQAQPDTIACWLVAVAATTSDGDPLFDQAELDTVIAKLKAKQAKAVNLVSAAIMRLSGYVTNGANAAATVEADAGN